MSVGYGAYSRLIDEDGEFYLYAYSSYDLNVDFNSYSEAFTDMDGMIIIGKEFFSEPTVIRKCKKKPNGKKEWIERKVYPEVDYEELLKSEKIIIENSKRIFRDSTSSNDRMALRILYKLYSEYIKTGEIPQFISIHC